jgi:hypothetical protein
VNAAAARATLASLLAGGSLERVPVDDDVVGNLLRQAGNHLRTARAGVEADDPEGAFQLAYDACRKTCLALVMATGLHTNPGVLVGRPVTESVRRVTRRAGGQIRAT